MDLLDELNGYYRESHKAHFTHLFNHSMGEILSECRKAAKGNKTEAHYHCEGEYDNRELISAIHIRMKELGLKSTESQYEDHTDSYTTITVSGWGK